MSGDGLLQQWLPKTREQRILQIVLWVAAILVVVAPIGLMFAYSFVSEFPITGPVSLTLEHYTGLLSDTGLLIDITTNTLLYTSGTTVVALVLGTLLAFIVAKYFPRSKLQLLILLPYGIPSVAALTGWIILLGDNGVLTVLLMDLFGLQSSPYSIYSIPGMIWVEGLHTAPIAYLLVLPAIKALPAAMEEASFTAGASRFRTVHEIILPLIYPSILSTTIFVFARTLATVATPSVLGVPRQIFTFGSAIPSIFLAGTSFSYSKALSFSVLMTIVTAVPVLYYMRITTNAGGRYATVAGDESGARAQYDTQTSKRRLYYLGVTAFVGIAGVLPFLAVVWDSLYANYALGFNLQQFTVAHYSGIVTGEAEGISNMVRVFVNTIAVGLIVPTTAMILGLLIAYSHQSIDLPTGGALSFLGSITLAVPGIAKGLGVLVAFIRTPLYGTMGILLLGLHGQALPIAMRYASPALARIGADNFNASMVVGGDVLGTFKNIALPLVSDDFVAGWMHIFVSVVRNIPIAILLYSTGSEVLSVKLLLVIQAGYFKTASSLAVVISILSLVPYMLLQHKRLSIESGP